VSVLARWRHELSGRLDQRSGQARTSKLGEKITNKRFGALVSGVQQNTYTYVCNNIKLIVYALRIAHNTAKQ